MNVTLWLLYVKKVMSVDKARMRKASIDILRALAIGAAVLIILNSPTGTRRLLRGIKKEWNKRNTRMNVERLYRKKFIDYQEMPDGSLRVVVTKKGKEIIRKIDLEHISLQKPARWDRKWRIVAFDISEERKKGREALRNTLYKLGFFKLQKSLFVHPYPCDEEIELVRDIYEVRQNEVMIVVAESIPHEKQLKKFFRLQ